ncbi:MAG TPA: hypothetical protein VF843_16970 [Streptosporangiaceae bacterium]
MPGPHRARPRRARGSWIPRLAGVAVVAVLAIGGLVAYLVTTHRLGSHQGNPAGPHRTVLSSRVIRAQTAGIIDFGPANDGDQFTTDHDDHPLMLQPGRSGLEFAAIPHAEIRAGVPIWTVDQMAGGSDIFIYSATGQCLTAVAGTGLRLAHCDLGPSQRWLPQGSQIALGQEYAGYASRLTGRCLTAPDGHPGRATLQVCGNPIPKTQQIAFWWNA